MAQVNLGTVIVRKHPHYLPGGMLYWEKGEKARVVGFTLGVSGVDVMLESLDGSTMDNIGARSLLDEWDVVGADSVTPILH